MENVSLKVPGMSCSHCEHAINGALKGLPGIGKININLDTKIVLVDYDPAKAGLDAIRAAIEEQGYDIA